MKKALLLLFISVFALHSCKDDDDDNLVALKSNLTVKNGIITDANGNTLYFFANDNMTNESECVGGCLDKWPVFFTEKIDLYTDGSLDASDFSVVEREDGLSQTTYKGWPLYYYSGDEAAGDTNGDGLNGVWFVAKPKYDIMFISSQLVGKDNKNYIIDKKGAYVEGEGMTEYMTDFNGRTIYVFSKDKKNANNFTSSNFSNDAVWPIIRIAKEQKELKDFVVPSNLDKNDFSTIELYGSLQLTYKGSPLYYFGGDEETKGNNKGVSFPSPGVWPIVNTTTVAHTSAAVYLTSDDVLVDGENNTLYFYSKDTKDVSECQTDCLPFYTDDISKFNLGLNLNADDFGTVNGKDQTTYKGWRLYYSSKDQSPGDINGDDASEWFVAKANYDVMYASSQLVGLDGNNYKSDYTVGNEITPYVVDAEGRTMYIFSKDTENKNNYTNEDFSNNDAWPIVEIFAKSIPSVFDADDFGFINVHGKFQLTYKNWPLYYFGQDDKRGDNKGVSVPSPGVWPIVNINSSTADAATVGLRQNMYLVDMDGKSLYFYKNDTKGNVSACNDADCLDIWEPFYTDDLKVVSGLELSDFETIIRADQSKQLTYKGWPLYYYYDDDGAGDDYGDDFDGEGDGGYLASNKYSLMYAASQLVGTDGQNYKIEIDTSIPRKENRVEYVLGDDITSYIVTINGETLYTYSGDFNGVNTYSKDGLPATGAMSIFYVELDEVPSVIGFDFGEIEVTVGGEAFMQTTYKGWPLYTFNEDVARGDNKGCSYFAPGNWPLPFAGDFGDDEFKEAPEAPKLEEE